MKTLHYISLSILTSSILVACGGGSSSGSGSPTPTPHASAFQQIRYSFGSTNTSGSNVLSVDGTGKVTIQNKTATLNSTQLTADELVAINADTATLLADIAANATPSCPNTNGADYVRFVGITGPDGKEYPVRDGAGNLCTYGGKTLDSEKVLNDVLSFTAKYDASVNAVWHSISYAFQLSSGAPQGDTFVVQSNGQFTAKLYPVASTASVPPTISGTLTASELAMLSADIDAIQSSATTINNCTAAGTQNDAPSLQFIDGKSVPVQVMFTLGTICGQVQDVNQLYNDINTLARKYMAAPGDTWAQIRYDSYTLGNGGSMSFSPDYATVAITHSDGSRSVATLSSADFATLKTDVNALVADINANSTPSCTNLLGTDFSKLITISIPSLGGDFKARNGAGDACVYNGKTDDANKLIADMDQFHAIYFTSTGNPWSQISAYVSGVTAPLGTLVSGSYSFSPDFPTAMYSDNTGYISFALLSSSDFATLKTDVNAVVANILANSTPDCTSVTGFDATKAIGIRMPGFHTDMYVRSGPGNVCSYNGKNADSSRLAQDIDGFVSKYFR